MGARWWRLALALCAASALLLPIAVHASGRPNATLPGLSPARARLLAASARGLLPKSLTLSQQHALLTRAAPDSLRLLVVGCDFSDSLLWGRDPADFPGWPPQTRRGEYLGPLLAFTGQAVYEFTAHDSVYFDIQMRRVRDYFATVSRGRFDMRWHALHTLVNLSKPMDYFGDDDTSSVHVVELAQDVIAAIDAQVDFRNYDTLVIFHAGAGQETDILQNSPEQLFSNYLDARDFQAAARAGALPEPRLPTADGIDVEHVLILPESESQDPYPGVSDGFFGTLGVYCFEFGLRLGMLNLADFTPSGAPDSQGAGQFDLMSYGLFSGIGLIPAQPSAMNRMLMGWANPVEAAPPLNGVLSMRIGATATTVAETLLVKVPISNREYWLAEYRAEDPDGNLRFTFPGDLNVDGFPDFYDAASDSGNGFPTTPFTPGEDVWESTEGAEWDFAMSEWLDGSRYRRGRGSGLYIWHVDERVIEDAVRSGRNVVNADAAHKGVDLEEADGIQDLDSSAPSVYFLGWDGDGFRGGGTDQFGPDTVPATATADGAPTGIQFAQISPAALDSAYSTEGELVGIVYDPTMSFSLSRGAATPHGIAERARRNLDRWAPRFDLRVAPLSAPAAPPLALIAAADSGVVYAFRPDLSEWVDGDADPATMGVLARARGPAGSPRWLGPPAVASLDGTTPAVVLSSAEGIYAFRGDSGAEVLDGDADPNTRGLLAAAAPDTFVGPPLLRWRGQWEIDQLARSAGVTNLHRIWLDSAGAPPGQLMRSIEPLGDGEPTSGATVLTADAGADPPIAAVLNAGSRTHVLAYQPGAGALGMLDLPGHAATLPLLAARLAPPEADIEVAWIDSSGRPRLASLPVSGTAALGVELGVGAPRTPPWSPPVAGAVSAGASPLLATVGSAALWTFDRGMHLRGGAPYRPAFAGSSMLGGATAAAPLLVDLDGDGQVELLWHDPVGRLHACDAAHRTVAGWPVAGPAEPTGSPVVADLDGDGTLELVAMGAFDALQQSLPAQQAVLTRGDGELRVYALAAPASAYAPWPQALGDAANSGLQRTDSSTGGNTQAGGALAAHSLVVYPNPALGDWIHVRVEVTRATRVEGAIFNLEGQRVRELPSSDIAAAAAYDQQISIADLAAGYYFCRLSVAGESAIRTFAVAH